MALARELGMGYVDIDRITPEPEAIKSVPLELIKQYRALPLKRTEWRVFSAVDQPNVSLEDIEEVTGLKMVRVLALADQLDAAIEKLG